MSDLREQLLAVFEAEARDHLDALRKALSDVRKGGVVDMREVFRRAHSLKGAARAVDAQDIEAVAHELEALLSGLLDAGGPPDAGQIRQAQALVENMSEIAVARRRAPAAPSGEAVPPESGDGQADFIRVRFGHVQGLAGSLTEVLAELDGLGGLPERLRELQQQATAISRSLSRIALETERSGRKSAVPSVAREAEALARALSAVGREQRDISANLARSTGRLGEDIARVSMARAGEVFAGLQQMVEDTAADAGIAVDLYFSGLDTQASRHLLQSLRDPVLHLLRNSIAHGVEPASDRSAGTKPARGAIGLDVTSSGGRLDITVWDDGRGPDLQRIEEAAIRQGLLPARRPGQPAPAEDALLALVFEPGFSTRDRVDRMAGRGMGLSVVAEAARALGGGAFMRRREGGGVETTVTVPMAMSRQTLLLVESAGQMFAIPSSSVAGMHRLRSDRLQTLDGRPVFELAEAGNHTRAPYVDLASLLGEGAGEGIEGEMLSVAVLRQAGRRLGVGVSSLAGVREAMVRPLPPDPAPDARRRSVATGVAQLESGRVMLVLSPDELFSRFNTRGAEIRPAAAVRPAERRRKAVLVVDDSITTRTLEKSILEANGYQVFLAVDGLQALEMLREGDVQVDVVITDIEMPRMDGFQLLSALKSDTSLATTPVVVMTSRGDPEDVRRGLELGADAYVTKQSFDQRELLSVIGQLA